MNQRGGPGSGGRGRALPGGPRPVFLPDYSLVRYLVLVLPCCHAVTCVSPTSGRGQACIRELRPEAEPITARDPG